MDIGYTPVKQLNGESHICWNLNAAVKENDSVGAHCVIYRKRGKLVSIVSPSIAFNSIEYGEKERFDRTIIER